MPRSSESSDSNPICCHSCGYESDIGTYFSNCHHEFCQHCMKSWGEETGQNAGNQTIHTECLKCKWTRIKSKTFKSIASQTTKPEVIEEEVEEISPRHLDLSNNGLINIMAQIEETLVERESDNSDKVSEDTERKLNESFDKAGFNSSRVLFHNSLIDYTEDVLLPEMTWNNRKMTICGSYGEGWGYNLSCMDGTVDADSDVDLTEMDDKKLHFKGCSCDSKDKTILVIETGEGHCIWNLNRGISESPASRSPSTCTQPHRDYCKAYQMACLPKSCTLFMENAFDRELMRKCKEVGVHIVSAQRPGHTCKRKELRISYSAMEKEIIRNFPEHIGRSFLLLKFIFKRELANHNLKSYMVKTLMFFVYKYLVITDALHIETSVLYLTKLALGLLKYFLTNYRQGRETVCLPHFFQDAPVFFKNPETYTSGWPDKKKIVNNIDRYLSDDLTDLVNRFMEQLQTATDKYFIQVECLYRIADVTDASMPVNGTIKDLLHVSIDGKKDLKQNQLTQTDRCMCALRHLSQQNFEGARDSLSAGLEVGKQSLFPHLDVIDSLDQEVLKAHFSEHFSKECQWIFPVRHKHLKYFPSLFQTFLPSDTQTLINFQALFIFLCREHLDSFSEEDWFKELEKDKFVDFQELYAFASTTYERRNFEWAIDLLKRFNCHPLELELTNNLRQREGKVWNNEFGYWDRHLPLVWLKNVGGCRYLHEE